MDQQTTGTELEAFLRKVNEKFHPEKIILFGSRATGEAWTYSDYDFMIISSAFENVPWLRRIDGVVELWESELAIDALPYTPEEFARKQQESSLVRRAVRQGKELGVTKPASSS
jgi:uncharacterized protein